MEIQILIGALAYVFIVYPTIKVIGYIRNGDSNGTEIFVVY